MYITLKEIRNLNIDSINSSSNEEINYYLELISKEIDEYCNTRFEPTEDIINIDYKKYIYTVKKPLLYVSSAYLKDIELVENEDFFVYSENSKIEFNDLNVENIKKALILTYFYGYTEVPGTVKTVIIDLLKLDLESKNIKYSGMQSENWDGEYSYTMNSSKDLISYELRKDILKRLDMFIVEPYKETYKERLVRARVI